MARTLDAGRIYGEGQRIQTDSGPQVVGDGYHGYIEGVNKRYSRVLEKRTIILCTFIVFFNGAGSATK